MHEKNNVLVLVDHLSFSVGFDCFVHDGVNPDDWDDTEKGVLKRLLEVFRFDKLEFTSRGGLNGYIIGWTCKNEINLCWGGQNDTIMVQISGKGCRLYESLLAGSGFDWLAFIRSIQKYRRHNFARLDIACDTFGTLNIDTMLKFTWAERFVSRFVNYKGIKGNTIREILFGSPKSRALLRIYDKTLERQQEVDDPAQVPENWIRLEFQFRDQAADSFIRAWENTGNISAAYFGIMANQLRYVKERNEQNPQRSEIIPWWKKFLNNADKIPMAYQGGLEYNLESLQRYVFGQAGSSIRTWLELHENDTEKLLEQVKYRKLNERQKNLLQSSAVLKNAKE